MQIGVCMGQVGSSWGDFLTQPTMVGQKKNSTQPNPTHMGRVEPMGWTIFFITIIIKLSRKKYITLATWVDKQNIH